MKLRAHRMLLPLALSRPGSVLGPSCALALRAPLLRRTHWRSCAARRRCALAAETGDIASAAEKSAKFDSAVVNYAQDGAWQKALALLGKMRATGLSPSVEAFAATIASLRRAVEPRRAEALLRDMFDACMPEDLFEAHAAPDPTHEGSPQAARVFALLLLMRRDGIVPNMDTYRTVMGLCGREGMWELSILLLEHAKRAGIEPGLFIYDELCSVLERCGRPELADALVDAEMAEKSELNPWSEAGYNFMDFHNFTVAVAVSAARVTFLDMAEDAAIAAEAESAALEQHHDVLAITSREFSSRGPRSRRRVHDVSKFLSIVTGVGKHSEEGVAVIKPALLDLLSKMGVEAQPQRYNPGCLMVRPDALRGWVRRTLEAAGKPVSSAWVGADASQGRGKADEDASSLAGEPRVANGRKGRPRTARPSAQGAKKRGTEM